MSRDLLLLLLLLLLIRLERKAHLVFFLFFFFFFFLLFLLIAKIRSRKQILNPMSGSSSSSSSAATAAVMAPRTKYDVFLSFRGEDTRNNFTSHLHAALRRKDVKTFIDDRSLQTGDAISHELCKAIEASMIYVIVFSENYASSSWCLGELVKIMECKYKYGRVVIPIFYKVDPSTVRRQKKTYGDAFVEHQNRLVPEVVMQRWEKALVEAADLSGYHSITARTEYDFVDDIAQDILIKLDRSILSDSDDKGMIGIEKHIAQIKTLLQLESEDVRIIGIWGMGGIGKTTLARALYHKLRNQFSSRCLVENAQNEIDRDGKNSLRPKYLSKLGFSDERLKRAKVLLILDDLKISSQVQELIGGHGNFGQGSRIIVTSRDLQVLKNAEADAIYEVEKMDIQDSLRLFSLYAFKKIYPVVGYKDLVEKILEYAKGVPLALQVLGSLLYDKKREVWESELEKLKELQHVDIFAVLKLSYDGLDRLQKDIFLDIACFYVGYSVNRVVELLDSCGFKSNSEIAVLKDRCLISIFEDEVFVHDLILEMGKEIVCKQSFLDPSGRSRLWNHKDISKVLKMKKGKAAIHCIFLKINQINTKVNVHPKVFNSMHNLRMLNFYKHDSLPNSLNSEQNLIILSALESLPDSLKVLHWDEFPQRFLPEDFCPENLVELCMRHSHLEQFWQNDQELPNLKRLDLSNSWQLNRIPDLSKSPNIEEIILSSCECLTSLPIDLCKLKSLRRLDLNHCKKLEKLPEIKETMEHLAVLVLGETAIQALPASLKLLVGLEELSLVFCSKLEIIPNSICNLNLLSKLDCSGCGKLTGIPNDIGKLESLRKLSLQGTGIVNLPESIAHLSSLESLDVSDCKKLVCIPQLPPYLKELLAFDCPSIRRVISNSKFKYPSDSKQGTFEFHLTNNDEQDLSAHGDVGADARNRITEDAYRFMYYCFPGSAVPDWFSYRGAGNSVTVDKDPLHLCNDNRFIGFAMCVVLQKDIKCDSCRFRLTFESDGRTHILPDDDQLNNSFCSSGRRTGLVRDHIFLWKYYFMDSQSIYEGIFHTHKFTFEISKDMSYCQEILKVKECGIHPLYTKEQDDIGGLVDSEASPSFK